MMTNAQLDNEKQSLWYEVDLYKERLEDAEEEHLELERQQGNLRRVTDLCHIYFEHFPTVRLDCFLMSVTK